MYLKTPKDLGEIIRITRKDLGLTQIELAKLCNVGTRFVSDLENGKPTCQIDKILTILNGLGLKIKLDNLPASYNTTTTKLSDSSPKNNRMRK